MSHICCGQVYIYISWTNIYLFIINNVANWRPFCTLRTLSYQQLTTFMSNVLALLNFNTCWHLLMPFILWNISSLPNRLDSSFPKNPVVRNFGFDPVVVWNFGFDPSVSYFHTLVDHKVTFFDTMSEEECYSSKVITNIPHY